MIITIKFKNEEQIELICSKWSDIGDAYMIENAFIGDRMYDNIIVEKENIEWVK